MKGKIKVWDMENGLFRRMGIVLTCMGVAVLQGPRRRGHACIHAKGAHAHRSLKQVVIAFRLRLGLYPVLAPHIHAMSPHQHRIGLRVILYCLPKPSCAVEALR